MDDGLIRKANIEVDGAQNAIDSLAVRSSEDRTERGQLWNDLFRVRESLDRAMTDSELQDVISLGSELRSRATQLLSTMSPASKRYLKRDGHSTVTHHGDGDFDFNMPATHEYEIDGDLTCKFGKNELTIPHGTRVTLNAHAGNQVKATFDNGVSIIFSDEDFPQDGIPVREVEERDSA